MTGLPSYPECNMKRERPKLIVDKDVADAVGRDFRVLPIFERGLFEYKYRQYYSLNTNELLQCRWRTYVEHFNNREIAPFTFINIRDYHFYNCVNRLIPTESIHKKKDFRYKLKVGPGVDYGGQMPIPQDLLMKRGSPISKTQPKRYSKNKKEEQKDKIDDKIQVKE